MYVSAWPGLNPSLLLRSPSPWALPFPLHAPHSIYFYVARYGIYHLFRALGFGNGDPVLVPDYHHGNEIRAIRAAGATPRYYPIRRTLEPDLNELARLCTVDPPPRALFVIHYLGWPQPMEALTALCRQHGLLLIEDCALSLLSEIDGRPLGTFGDYAVFCLYKTLPLPHGGLLVQNQRVLPDLDRFEVTSCGMPSLVGRTAELLLDWSQSRASGLVRPLRAAKGITGRLLSQLSVRRAPVGDSGFDLASANLGMSALCRRLLELLDYGEIRRRRRENFRLLGEKLADYTTMVRTDLPDGICPLFLPILVEDKPAAARALEQRGISAVEFWNSGDPVVTGSGHSDAQFLRDHVLELPIHQGVRVAQIEYMAEQVAKLGFRPWEAQSRARTRV